MARVLTEAGDLMEQHGQVYWEPELFRLRGRLAAAEGRGAAAEAATGFERALALARQRGAHLLELRAATDLARLRSSELLTQDEVLDRERRGREGRCQKEWTLTISSAER